MGEFLMEHLVSIQDIYKYFPLKQKKEVINAVTGVNLSIKHGETLGLIGESGSGKTTVGRCVLRLIEPNSGKIIFNGVDITHLPKEGMRSYRQQMQMVFQDPFASLDPRMDIEASISEPLVYSGASEKHRKERVLEVIKDVGLDKQVLTQFPHQLSAGDQQRVGIARALATRPLLIILDEPVSSLDLTIRSQILELLANIQRQTGVSYLYISHDLTTVKYLCHRVAIMYLSKIVEIGDKDDVFRNPVHPYSRALLSSALPVDPRIHTPRYYLTGEIPSPINLPTGCVLHNRCPEARPECKINTPMLETIEKSNLNEINYYQKDVDEGKYKVACLRVEHMLSKTFVSPFK